MLLLEKFWAVKKLVLKQGADPAEPRVSRFEAQNETHCHSDRAHPPQEPLPAGHVRSP